jgi:hypothetical protein
MRVELVEKIPERAGGNGTLAGEAAASLAIKNFLAAIESEDSLFSLLEPLAPPTILQPAQEATGSRVCLTDILLGFRQAEHGGEKSLRFLLLEKLVELLKEAGSHETLQATFCMVPGRIQRSQEKPNQKELTLWIGLAAKGESAEQAVLRLGLGLAHIQQALLFSSRFLRLHLAQPKE